MLEENYERIQSYPYNYIEPTEDRPNAGVVICNWIISADDLPAVETTDLSQQILVEGLQQYIADIAAFMAYDGDIPQNLQMLYSEAISVLKNWREENTFNTPVIIGGYKNSYGRYAYRNQAVNSLIVYPKW